MPITLCKGCKSTSKKAITYVTDPNKAERIYAHGLDENRNFAEQFQDTALMFGKGDRYGERKYYHVKFSFSPTDNVANVGKLDAEIAEKISNTYLQKNYSEHEYVLAVHTDTEHIHTHAILNAVRFTDGKKLQLSNRDLVVMKDEINDISEQYGVSSFDWKQAVKNKRLQHKQEQTTEPKLFSQSEKHLQNRHGEEWSLYSWKEVLREKIDEAKTVCSSREELQAYLQDNYDISMPRNTEKTVSFRHPSLDETVRGAKLGADYTSQSLELVFKQNNERGISYAKIRSSNQNGIGDSSNEVKRAQSTKQNGAREQSTQGEFDGVYGTIRAIEEGAKQFSGTGREEIRERERIEQEELERVAEQKRNLIAELERINQQLEEQQQAARRRHRSHDYEYEM